jgi:lipopolysaccharide biosynthesis regulator YciM
MGFRLYKSVRLGKGIRLNLSKTGVGISAGFPGMRYSVHSSGRTTRTVGVPGTGVDYRKDSRTGASGSRSSVRTTRRVPSLPPPPVPLLPKAGLLAPKGEKEFVKGIVAFMGGEHQAALLHFNESKARDPAKEHVAEEYFAAFSLIALNRLDEAVALLEEVVRSSVVIPDSLMRKYGIGGHVQVTITPSVLAELPNSSLTAALLLAELYQDRGDLQRAVELLESLGSVAPDAVFALSLGDLYFQLGKADDVLRVSEQFTQNLDDATCQLLVFKAGALQHKGLNDGALQVLKEALKSKRRDPGILNEARYLRGQVYEATGKAGRARQEWERIYAVDPSFADVAFRLGVRSEEQPKPNRPDIE